MVDQDAQFVVDRPFAKLLRKARTQAGLTRKALAERAGLSEQAIGSLERGRRRYPYPHTVSALASALNVPPAEQREWLQAASPEPKRLSPETMMAARNEGGRPPHTHNLPAEVTSFIGRERELADIQHMLFQTRLLTLTGVGGCGKTHLALRAATDLVQRFADGVWVIQLAPLTDEALVPRAVADALEVRGGSNQPILESVVAALATRKLLLVLDNCEHLVTACARLAAALMSGAPYLRILSTSREPLRVPGEVVRSVPPLALPPPGTALPSVEQLARVESVRLFVDRASGRHTDFRLSAETAPAVVEICRRVEGLPLAIELAAAQLGALAVNQVAAQLRNSFGLLERGNRTVPRHETLRATLDWSHNLLSEAERVLFRRLAVFAGTFAADAAVQVCSDEQSGADAALAVLTTLVEKSLVEVHIERQEARYRLLEPIRQYAWQRLVLEHETALLQRRHAEYYVSVAEEAAPQLTSVVQRGPAISRLTSDLDNVRAVLSWCQRSPEPAAVELGLRLGAALNWFWRFRGELSEGLDRLTDLLGRTDGPGTSGRAGALCAAGELAWFLGQNELARTHLEKSATLYRTLGDKRGLAYALQLLAVPVDPLTGQRLAAESLRLFEEQGDAWGVARTASVLAVLRPTEPERERAVEDALARWRALGDRWAIAQHLNFLGDMARHQGRDARAEACYREALDVLHEADLPGMVPRLLHNLGYLALRGGHVRPALRLFQESMALFRDQGEQSGLADSLEGVAIGVGEQGQAECAARLFGAAARLREAIHARPWPGNAADVSLGMGRVRDRLDEASFDAAWVAGRALSSEQVLREVLALG